MVKMWQIGQKVLINIRHYSYLTYSLLLIDISRLYLQQNRLSETKLYGKAKYGENNDNNVILLCLSYHEKLLSFLFRCRKEWQKILNIIQRISNCLLLWKTNKGISFFFPSIICSPGWVHMYDLSLLRWYYFLSLFFNRSFIAMDMHDIFDNTLQDN